MSASDRLRRAISAAAALLAGGCAPEVPPTGRPDLTRVAAAYAAPGGSVERSGLGWLDAAAARIDRLGGGYGHVALATALREARDRLAAATLQPRGGGVRLDGVVTAELRCIGSPDPTGELSAEIVDGRLSPEAWGTIDGCPLGSSVKSAPFRGRFALQLSAGDAVLVRLDGDETLLGPSRLEVDFRVAAGRLETRAAAVDGEVIVSRAGAELDVRAKNGAFRCDVSARTCRPIEP